MQEEKVSRTIQREGLVGVQESVLPMSSSLSGKEFVMRVFGTSWTVREVSSQVMKELSDDDNDGYCDFDNETILINGDLSYHRKCLALTHELLHALFDFIGYDKDDEKLVLALEHGVYDLINSYPKEYKRFGR